MIRNCCTANTHARTHTHMHAQTHTLYVHPTHDVYTVNLTRLNDAAQSGSPSNVHHTIPHQGTAFAIFFVNLRISNIKSMYNECACMTPAFTKINKNPPYIMHSHNIIISGGGLWGCCECLWLLSCPDRPAALSSASNSTTKTLTSIYSAEGRWRRRVHNQSCTLFQQEKGGSVQENWSPAGTHEPTDQAGAWQRWNHVLSLALHYTCPNQYTATGSE